MNVNNCNVKDARRGNLCFDGKRVYLRSPKSASHHASRQWQPFAWVCLTHDSFITDTDLPHIWAGTNSPATLNAARNGPRPGDPDYTEPYRPRLIE